MPKFMLKSIFVGIFAAVEVELDGQRAAPQRRGSASAMMGGAPALVGGVSETLGGASTQDDNAFTMESWNTSRREGGRRLHSGSRRPYIVLVPPWFVTRLIMTVYALIKARRWTEL